MMNLKKDAYILTLFIILSTIIRFFSFFPSVIIHDESTYLEIAREMLHGKLFYVDLVDIKPIGIFLIMEGIIAVFGNSIFAVRFVTALVVSLTAFLLYKISYFNCKEQKPAVASGIIYIFYISIFIHFGVSPNPEHFFILLTALGLYVFIRSRDILSMFVCGLIFGLGFMIKYVVLFDFAALLLYYFIRSFQKKDIHSITKTAFHCIVACIGLLIPLGITLLYYYKIGHLSDFLEYTFGVSTRYAVKRPLIKTIVYVGDFFLRFLPFTFFFLYVLFREKKESDDRPVTKGLMVTWCSMVLAIIIIPGKPLTQYFMQLMLPVSLYAGNFFSDKLSKPVWLNRIIRYPYGTAILVVFIIVNVLFKKHDHFNKPDMPRTVASYLKTIMQPDDDLFTGNYDHILYFLLEKDSPTKYVHRTLLCYEHHQKTLQIDVPKEMNNIMNKKIDYIVMKGAYCFEPMNQYISDNYSVIRAFKDSINVYKRKAIDLGSE